GGAVITAFHRNIVYAAFGLLFTFSGVVGLYVMANADFLAVTQLLVYVGGILILLIFGVMLTNRLASVNITVAGGGSRWFAALLSLGVLIILCFAFFGSESSHTIKTPDGKTKTISTWASYQSEPWAHSPWNKDANERILSQKYGTAAEVKAGEGSNGTANEIGILFLTDYLLPFEVVSVVLLVALVGATMIARQDPTPEEDMASDALRATN
ncbi:MAG TPA: NADH-quinone oxidoreductase subunit J, partial [Steroidobacteraceae bacterium]|nr:NADH-quinone oxidoreductase subunit J [Steroidobacteraceae bacterium]